MTTWDPLSFDFQIREQTADFGGAVLASIGSVAAWRPALILPPNGQSGDYSLRMSAGDFSKRPSIGAAVRVNGDACGRVIQTKTECGFLVLRVADFVDE